MGRACGIAKKAGLHTLRHSYATHLLEAGTDLPTSQRLLGHNQPSTTPRHTRVEQSHLQRTGSPQDTLLALHAAGVKACPIPGWLSEPPSEPPPGKADANG